MTPAEERAFEREMQAIADAVSDILNRAPSLDAAPAGIALGLLQAMKGGAHNTYLWPERMAETAAFIAGVSSDIRNPARSGCLFDQP